MERLTQQLEEAQDAAGDRDDNEDRQININSNQDEMESLRLQMREAEEQAD